jgi:hypothetical protein
MKLKAIAFAAGLAAIIPAQPAAAQSGCTRDQLQAIADSWVDSLNGGTPYGKMQLAEFVAFNKNMAVGFMSEFFDMEPNKVDWNLSVLDTTACKATVETVIQDKGGPRGLVAQLSSGLFGVSPIDIMYPASEASEKPDGFTGTWAPIPEEQRMNRESLIAAADGYLADKQPDAAKDRLYVVDETLGAVNVYTRLAGQPTSVTVRVEGGEITAAHVLAT